MRRVTLLACAFVLVAVAVPSASGQGSAHQAASTEAKAPAFEAVTIKPNPDVDHWMIEMGLDQYRAIDLPLMMTIMRTYFAQGYASRDRVKGAPAWVMNDNYDIVAKLDAATVEEWKNLTIPKRLEMYKPMLNAMMADRFKLVVHTEPTEIQGFALVVGKHPLKLKEATADEKPPDHALKLVDGGMMVPMMPGAPTKELTFFQVSMASLAANLTRTMGVPMVDQTGLAGAYNFELPFKPDDQEFNESAIDAASGGPLHTREPVYRDYQAIGLELKPIKVPTVNLVIDHIELPSEN